MSPVVAPITAKPDRHLAPLLRWAAAMLVALLLGFSGRWALADGVELSHLSSQRVEDGLELSFGTRFELPPAAEDALLKGVPIYFVAEAAVLRSRWYWRDDRVARAVRSWRLEWKALTREYRVGTGGLNQSYTSLSEALASLRGVSGWRIAEAKDLEEAGRYYLEFSYRLDTSQLPRPMQIGLGSPQGWALGLERSLTLNPDFSPRAIAP